MDDKLKKILPYFGVSLAFIISVILIIVLLDSILFPMLIHDKGQIKVPELIGKNITEAEKLIHERELTIGQISEQFSQKIPSGIVINQTPKSGAEVKAGRSVYLSVSKGKEMVMVPYLIGQNLRTARLSLKNTGLEIGDVDFEFNDNFGNDTVFAQLVSSGRMVPFGTTVSVTVSKGPENQVIVPSLVGKPFADVNLILEESGLVLGTVMTRIHETYLPNTVISQTPQSGDIIRMGDAVNVIISQ